MSNGSIGLCFEIDFVTSKVSSKAKMKGNRSNHGVVKLNPQYIFAFGGKSGSRILKSAERYDIE